MSKHFPLKEKTIKVRDMDVVVRELTQAERNTFVTSTKEDKFRGPSVVASLGTVSPKMTEAEAHEEPSAVIEEIVDAIMELSGMKAPSKAEPQKEPDAR